MVLRRASARHWCVHFSIQYTKLVVELYGSFSNRKWNNMRKMNKFFRGTIIRRNVIITSFKFNVQYFPLSINLYCPLVFYFGFMGSINPLFYTISRKGRHADLHDGLLILLNYIRAYSLIAALHEKSSSINQIRQRRRIWFFLQKGKELPTNNWFWSEFIPTRSIL